MNQSLSSISNSDMKRFIIRLLIWFLPILLAGITVYVLPVDEQYSYNQMLESCDRGNWLYSRIFENPEDIDVVLMGTSRTITSVNSHLVQDQLSGHNVANLGFCRPGRSLHLTLLNDVIQNKRPSALVLEVREYESRFSHPDFPFVAEPAEILGAELKYNQRYFEDIFNSFQHRLLYQRSKALNRLPEYVVYEDTHLYEWNNHDADTVEMKKFKESNEAKAILEIPDEGWNSFTYSLRRAYPNSYVDQIAELCSDHGVQLIFLYLPGYGSPLPKPLEHERYEDLGTLIIAPDSLFENMDRWADPEHMNQVGSKGLSAWLGTELRSVIHNPRE
jgi:hypothetical protein